MQTRPSAASFAAAAFAAFAATVPARAANYYVSMTGNDGNDGSSAETPFATIDQAVACATAEDTIFVAPGDYETTTQWGPNLAARLVGTGETRDEVVIRSAGTYRTLRMAAGSWLENVTVIGITVHTSNADKGGAIEISGGTVTNCVIRDGHSNYASARSGGNIFMTAGLVENCVISNGNAKSRGGNINMEGGTVRNCLISDGQSTAWGGNVYIKGSSAVVTNCVIKDGVNNTTAANAYGGNVYIENVGTVADSTISGGTSYMDGGNVYITGAGVLKGCAITGGTSRNGHGGNVRITGGAAVVSDCTISDGTCENTANNIFGANLYVNSAATLSRCRFSGGTIGTYNGGSLCVNNSSAVVEDCLVEGSQNGGVLLYTTSRLYNCTIVRNDAYGVWAWSNNQHVFNTVIYGNTQNEWDGNLPSADGATFTNCASSASSRLVTAEAWGASLRQIDSSAFADYENGGYSPAPGGDLVDKGASDPRGASASATDLAGNPRASGAIDIGCYEYQKPDMTVRIDGATYSQAFAPATVTFTHAAENSADPDTVVFTYDFGDGSATETTSEATISHPYAEPGVYTVTISAESECEDDVPANMVYEGYVRVASSTIYVTPGNGAGTFPYDTAEKGYGNLKTAVQNALDGYTILLGEGVHETTDQVSFSKALTLRGVGASPEAVIVRNTTETPNTYYHRVLEMNNADGRIENLTIENGCVSSWSGNDQYGGNLRLVAGVVSNCVIRGGRAVVGGGNGAGAGVAIAGAATLTHCVISNNVVEGTSANNGYAGGAVFLWYGVQNARISNCLVSGNRYVTSGETVKSGAAGIRFGGSNNNTAVENCTIVANIVEGNLSDDSAGIHCTTWYGRLRNNIVVGNYETGKEKFTSVKLDFNSSNNYTYHNNITDDAVIAESGTKSQNNKLASAASLFKDFAGGDFRLKAGCAACNAGTLSGLAFLPSADLAGNPRVAFARIDAGCYESQDLPATVFILR